MLLFSFFMHLWFPFVLFRLLVFFSVAYSCFYVVVVLLVFVSAILSCLSYFGLLFFFFFRGFRVLWPTRAVANRTSKAIASKLF